MLGQEALHHQAVRHRVDRADPQQMRDQRAHARAARGHADAEPPGLCRDLGDGQEVSGEAVPGDDPQLVLQPVPALPLPVVAAAEHARRAPVRERPVHRLGARAHELGLGQVQPAEPERAARIDHAGLGRLLGGREQPPRVPAPAARGLRDPPGDPFHLPGVLQPPLPGVEPGRVTGVDRHQETGGVQDVGDLAPVRVGVAHGVGEHRGHLLLGGEAQHARGQPQRPRAGAGPPVPGRLDTQRPAEPLTPGAQQDRGPVRPSRRQRLPHLGVRPEEDEQFVVRTGQVLPGDALVRRRRHQSAQLGPAAFGPGQEHRALRRLRDERAAPGRSGPLPFPRHRPGRRYAGHRQIGAEQRPDPGLRTRLGEAHRARQGVPVGQRQGVEAPLGGPLGQRGRVAGPVPQRVAARRMEVRKRHTHLLLPMPPLYGSLPSHPDSS